MIHFYRFDTYLICKIGNNHAFSFIFNGTNYAYIKKIISIKEE